MLIELKLFLDIRRRAVVYIKNILKSINLQFLNKRKSKKFEWKKRRPLAKLPQLNHPNNCHDIDIYRFTKNLTGFYKIQINFRKDPRYKVEIVMEDRKQSLSRTYKYNKFGISGSRVFLNNLTENHYKYPAIRFINTFLLMFVSKVLCNGISTKSIC